MYGLGEVANTRDVFYLHLHIVNDFHKHPFFLHKPNFVDQS